MICSHLVARLLLMAMVAVRPSASAPDQPTPAPEGHERAADRVTLTWHARQEEGVYGYLVYRADRREGPYIRINREIIHARGVESEVADYQYVDADVEPGRTYYYYLDFIASTGHKHRFSGVISKKVASAEP